MESLGKIDFSSCFAWKLRFYKWKFVLLSGCNSGDVRNQEFVLFQRIFISLRTFFLKWIVNEDFYHFSKKYSISLGDRNLRPKPQELFFSDNILILRENCRTLTDSTAHLSQSVFCRKFYFRLDFETFRALLPHFLLKFLGRRLRHWIDHLTVIKRASIIYDERNGIKN